MVVFGILGDISLYFTTFFEFFDKVFSAILLWLTISKCPSTVGCFPFYSVILRFWGTIDSPPLLPWVPEPILCQQLWWLVPSLFLIVFFFRCFFPKSLLLTFRSKVSLESWPLICLPSRLLHLKFSNSAFWLPFLLSFFPSELISSLPGWNFIQLLLFVVLFSGFPEVLALCSRIVSPQALWFLSTSLGG